MGHRDKRQHGRCFSRKQAGTPCSPSTSRAGPLRFSASPCRPPPPKSKQTHATRWWCGASWPEAVARVNSRVAAFPRGHGRCFVPWRRDLLRRPPAASYLHADLQRPPARPFGVARCTAASSAVFRLGARSNRNHDRCSSAPPAGVAPGLTCLAPPPPPPGSQSLRSASLLGFPRRLPAHCRKLWLAAGVPRVAANAEGGRCFVYRPGVGGGRYFIYRPPLGT